MTYVYPKKKLAKIAMIEPNSFRLKNKTKIAPNIAHYKI